MPGLSVAPRWPGLAEAAQDLTTRVEVVGTAVDVDVPTDPDWSVGTSRLAYRVLQEGLRNVVTHSGATRADITVRREGDEVHVEVSDNGRGLDSGAEPEPGHVGLQLLRENLLDFGGSLALKPRDAGGTTLAATIPVDVFDG